MIWVRRWSLHRPPGRRHAAVHRHGARRYTPIPGSPRERYRAIFENAAVASPRSIYNGVLVAQTTSSAKCWATRAQSCAARRYALSRTRERLRTWSIVPDARDERRDERDGGEKRLIRRDGEVIYVRRTMSVVRDKHRRAGLHLSAWWKTYRSASARKRRCGCRADPARDLSARPASASSSRHPTCASASERQVLRHARYRSRDEMLDRTVEIFTASGGHGGSHRQSRAADARRARSRQPGAPAHVQGRCAPLGGALDLARARSARHGEQSLVTVAQISASARRPRSN